MNNDEKTIAILNHIRWILLGIGGMIAIKFFLAPDFSFKFENKHKHEDFEVEECCGTGGECCTLWDANASY